jgi:aromatic ring-opening dioxygenase catalytic subunit (LigB family)
MRMPVAFVPHGGGPWPFVDLGFDRPGLDRLSGYLASVPGRLPATPRALLVVSAHWEEKVPTVTASPHPPLVYDYSGFPPEAYRITWPAPGDPALAARVRTLLEGAGIASAENATRGFDHGTFVPLKVMYPAADVPAVQLSILRGLDPEAHLALGRAIAPLRDEGIFIVCSGMTYHDLRGFFDPASNPAAVSEAFDRWLRETVPLDAVERDRRLARWETAPSARAAHPREEHLLPLMVAAGAAGADRAVVAFDDIAFGVRLSAYEFR